MKKALPIALVALTIVTETATAHVPSRCAAVTSEVETATMSRVALIQELQASAERESITAVLEAVAALIESDAGSYVLLARWSRCVAELE